MDEVTTWAKERLWPVISSWGQERLTGSDLASADELLVGLYRHDVQWALLLHHALSEAPSIDISSDAYWGPLGPNGMKAPRSVLAFLGVSARLRVAADPATPLQILDQMGDDWEQSVRDAVFASGRLRSDDPRTLMQNVTTAEAIESLEALSAKMRRTEHEHEWWHDPFEDRRTCTMCGVEYVPHDHAHDWFEWEGASECRICGEVGPVVR